MEHSGISDRTEIYPGIRDRLEALVLLAETRLERIEKQQAEIKRLENANQDLVDERDIFARTLDKRDAEIERLRAYVAEIEGRPVLKTEWEQQQTEIEHLQQLLENSEQLAEKYRQAMWIANDDKRLLSIEIEQLRDSLVIANTTQANLHSEIDKLREENDALKIRIGTYYAGNADGGIVKQLESEIERLREETLVQSEFIETLRGDLRELLALLEDGVFVRDTSRDDDTAYFLKQGMRVAEFLARLNEVLGDVPRAD